MSSRTLEQRIRECAEYKRGRTFKGSEVRLADIIDGEKIAVNKQRVKRALDAMVASGELKQNGNIYTKNSGTDWLRKPWRTQSNEQLGIVA